MISKPAPGEAPKYYEGYFDKLTETDMIEAMQNEMSASARFSQCIPAEKESYRYLDGKWTIKEVVSHIIDTERIFLYRALRFSRKDPLPLPGYDENLYAPNANAEHRNLKDMIAEYKMVRSSGIMLFQAMTEEMLDLKGNANNNILTPRSIGWMIAGHSKHHFQVIRERYL